MCSVKKSTAELFRLKNQTFYALISVTILLVITREKQSRVGTHGESTRVEKICRYQNAVCYAM